MRRARIQIAAVCSACVVCALVVPGTEAATSPNKRTLKAATKWLTSQPVSRFNGFVGLEADSTVALTAAKRSGISVARNEIDQLIGDVRLNALQYATTAGATGKVILAAVAAGKNPRCFGESGQELDLITLLDTYAVTTKEGTRYGSSSFDQALAMLALKAAAERVPKKAVKFLRERRGKRGWGFSLKSGPGDDVESTTLTIEALRAAGISKSDGDIQAAWKWVKLQQNAEGGYNPSGNGAASQADTTAYAIRAADALGGRLAKAERVLRKLKNKSGAIIPETGAAKDYAKYIISTQDAITALARRHYPVVARSKRAASCVK